jgi:hypothetical protein
MSRHFSRGKVDRARRKLRRLCKAIVEEDDPEALTRLIAELTEHLQQDQNAIKAKISQFNKRAKH